MIGDLFKYAGLAFRYAPLVTAAVKAVRNSPEIMVLLEAVPSIVKDVAGPPDANTTLHETLVKNGVDTKQLAEAIHPVGPNASGNPDAFNAGSNNANV